ncbi:MAG: YcaO-like family protein [Bdellovibrionaceae bacterium]|nr:YcaO-like family protein [Pseudobdellovibrionaceae bacterium]MBX3033462.1 YcaO-like family protein [Pseudobdellovibrionaceae bacterium]
MRSIKAISLKSESLFWEMSEVSGYWHVNCIDKKFDVGGSGFSVLKETAKKKSFSELNERFLVTQIKSIDCKKKEWGLHFDNSCSGFAVGYSKSKTILRAILEGCERWTLSQWIDYKISLRELKIKLDSPMHQELTKFFSGYSIFFKTIPIYFAERILKAQVVVFLGWTEKGVFAGYGTKLIFEEALDHALVEAVRNFLIYENQQGNDQFPYDRIRFFAENKPAAKAAIHEHNRQHWKMPALNLLKIDRFDDLWIARAIFDGWEPWQKGSVSRFLY